MRYTLEEQGIYFERGLKGWFVDNSDPAWGLMVLLIKLYIIRDGRSLDEVYIWNR